MAKKNLLVLTPIDSIGEILEILKKEFDLIYLPNASLDDLCKYNLESIWGVFTNPNRSKIQYNKNFFKLVPKLEVICTASTGTVHIDLAEAEKRGTSIISLKTEIETLKTVPSTSELAFTLMMSSLRHISNARTHVINGNWDCEFFVGRQLKDLSVGILGMGRLGTIFGSFCIPFGAKLSFFDPYVDKSNYSEIQKINSLSEFLSNIDILSIHIHAENNDNFVDKKFLEMCKDNLLIVNTSRGEVIDENALIRHMKKNEKFSYAADVIKDEILLRNESPIIKALKDETISSRLLITPHIGGMSEGARKTAYNRAVELLIEYAEK